LPGAIFWQENSPQFLGEKNLPVRFSGEVIRRRFSGRKFCQRFSEVVPLEIGKPFRAVALSTTWLACRFEFLARSLRRRAG
jgi:hypothetical protein